MELTMNNITIPSDLINIILDYDGRIKYKKGEYVNSIHKHDFRYDIIRQHIGYTKKSYETIEVDGSTSFFEYCFNKYNKLIHVTVILTFPNTNIKCIYDPRSGWEQIGIESL